MNQVHFTFNNFFDYQLVLENLDDLNYYIIEPLSADPNKLQITYKWKYTKANVVRQITNACKPLDIQFTTSLEVTEDSQ